MRIDPLKLPGTFEIHFEPRSDERGYFMRVYDEAIFRDAGLQTVWVQENQSRTLSKHTIRGMHFQRPPHSETKLVRAIAGIVLDVFVDLRKDSPTYGLWDAVELAAERHNAVYIPRGFAHGFCTLTEDCTVQYKVDNAYAPNAEGGLRWDDPTLAIAWPTDSPHLSTKDAAHPLFDHFESPFI